MVWLRSYDVGAEEDPREEGKMEEVLALFPILQGWERAGSEPSGTINSNQPIIQQLFFKLQSVVRNRNSPIYITHIRVHSCLPGLMTYGNEQADKLVSFATPE